MQKNGRVVVVVVAAAAAVVWRLEVKRNESFSRASVGAVWDFFFCSYNWVNMFQQSTDSRNSVPLVKALWPMVGHGSQYVWNACLIEFFLGTLLESMRGCWMK